MNFQASFFLLNQFSQYTFSTSITFIISLIFNYHESDFLNLIHLTVLKCTTFHFDSDLIKRLKTATWTMQMQSREQVIKSHEMLFSLLKMRMRENISEVEWWICIRIFLDYSRNQILLYFWKCLECSDMKCLSWWSGGFKSVKFVWSCRLNSS